MIRLFMYTRPFMVDCAGTLMALGLLGSPASPSGLPQPIREVDATKASGDSVRVIRADAALADMIKDGFAGSVLVARGDRVLFTADYGLDVPDGAVPSYWVASITKQFTAAAILAFAETGEITLDDPISMYLPEVPDDKGVITIRQLLTHTSGLPQAYAADGVEDRDAAARAILSLKLAREPGAGFGYANDNYSLLAILLEVVAGAKYETFLRNYFFQAAGMRHTGFWGQPVPQDTWLPPLAGSVDSSVLAPNWGFRGGVGTRASVEDLFRWMLTLRRGKSLGAETVKILLGPHLSLETGTGIGCGWFSNLRGDGSLVRFTRGQEQFGANAVIYWYPALDLTIIAATHAGPAETGDGPVTGWSRRCRDVLIDIFVDGN